MCQDFCILFATKLNYSCTADCCIIIVYTSLVPRPFVGETAWQLTRVQTVYG